MKEIIEKLYGALDSLSDYEGGNAVTESDIRDAELDIKNAIDMLKNL